MLEIGTRVIEKYTDRYGTIIEIDEDDNVFPYKVKFDDDEIPEWVFVGEIKEAK